MVEPRKMRYCPCCAQELSAMTEAEYWLWLKAVEKRLRLENKPELAEALAAFSRAIGLSEPA
jgi:hypothetical protein